MGNFSCFKHIEDIADLCFFSRSIVKSADYPIPLNKILFTLFRREYLKTILVEEAPANDQYLDECRGTHADPKYLIRYHFFKTADPSNLSPGIYGGYCDVRPEGSIAEAFITTETITSGKDDSYVFMPCHSKMSIAVPLPDQSSMDCEIVGFPYTEKNHKETMCAQAALLGIVQYWQRKNPGSFLDVKSAKDINRLAGVDEDQTGGLDARQIKEFFASTGFDAEFLDYSMRIFSDVDRLHLATDIYSFIESQCPVLAAVKTHNGGHALTFIGHTFDKNSWAAMADPGYFGKTNDYFHENTSWIENLIVQDDNFGPYYFFPFHRLSKIINCAIIALPSSAINILPHEAANFAVRQTLYSAGFLQFLHEEIAKTPLLDINKQWFDEFIKHLSPTCGDGLVPRTILRTGQQMLADYADHQFSEVVDALLNHPDSLNQYYWVVELSWPSIYCFGQSKSGAILVNASNAEISFVHVPGMCIAFSGGKPFVCIAEEEDAPFVHLKPGVLSH